MKKCTNANCGSYGKTGCKCYKNYDYSSHDTPPKDKCVLCGVETEYTIDTHVDQRIGYIDGAGQLCNGCYDKLNEDQNR